MAFYTICHLAKTWITTVRNTYLTRKIAARFFGLVRGKNSKASSEARSCPPPPRPGPSLKKASKVYGRQDCTTHYPICGVKMMSLKNCKPRMWTLEMEKCCKDLCKWAHPRFDDLYYLQSDKRKAKYQRTWCEFGDTYISPKEICCYERPKHPKLERRKPKKPAASHANSIEYAMNLLCRNRLSHRCVKITWPGCRGALDPPVCKLRRPHCGPRKCAPYPCFSECRKTLKPPMRPIECNCLKIEARCWSH